jgi:3-deoxy-7-phosphoheptulonate synthase
VHKCGQVAIVETRGNEDCHNIQRGGQAPNYDDRAVGSACEELRRAGLPERLMIDCSHANSSKQYQKQLDVAGDIAQRIAAGERRIVGLMVESNLVEGRQDLASERPLVFGQSVTDACLGWESSVGLLDILAQAVRDRRASS